MARLSLVHDLTSTSYTDIRALTTASPSSVIPGDAGASRIPDTRASRPRIHCGMADCGWSLRRRFRGRRRRAAGRVGGPPPTVNCRRAGLAAITEANSRTTAAWLESDGHRGWTGWPSPSAELSLRTAGYGRGGAAGSRGRRDRTITTPARRDDWARPEHWSPARFCRTCVRHLTRRAFRNGIRTAWLAGRAVGHSTAGRPAPRA